MEVTYYHSVICPRCQMAGLFLNQLKSEFPDLRVKKIEILANQRLARSEGVKMIPSLVCGQNKLSGFYLTKKRIKKFLNSV